MSQGRRPATCLSKTIIPLQAGAMRESRHQGVDGFVGSWGTPQLAAQLEQGSVGKAGHRVRARRQTPIHPPSRQQAMTLLELLTAVAACAILASIAIPTYQSAVQKTKVSAAVRDILQIEVAIQRYHTL